MWLYVPYQSAQVEAGSNSGLNSRALECLSRSLTLNAKPQQRRSLSRAWKKKPYLKLLSGLTCEPSEMNRSALSWARLLGGKDSTCSAGDTRARTSRRRAGERVYGAIREAFGSTSLERLRRINPNCVFSRTFRGTLLAGSISFAGAFNDWVTGLRRDCLRRRKQVQAIKENDYSLWQTAVVGDTRPNNGQGVSFKEQAENWKTPHGCGNIDHTGKQGAGGEFADQVVNWPTPGANDAMRSQMSEDALIGSVDKQESRPKGKPKILAAEVCRFSRRDPVNSGDGEKSSKSRRRLNPQFVEWLMGWPFGWSDYGCSETALCQFRRRMRSRLLQLVCSEMLKAEC